MKYIISILIVLISLQVSAITEPKLNVEANDFNLELGPDITRAMTPYLEKKSNPYKIVEKTKYAEFMWTNLQGSISEAAPMVSLGDINGDEIKDMVVMLYDTRKYQLVALISDKRRDSYKTLDIQSWRKDEFEAAYSHRLGGFLFSAMILPHDKFVYKGKYRQYSDRDFITLSSFGALPKRLIYNGRDFIEVPLKKIISND